MRRGFLMVCAVVAVAALASAAREATRAPVAAAMPWRDPGKLRPIAVPPPRLGAPSYDAERGVYTASYGRGMATLTLDHALQRPIEAAVENGRTQWGAVVMLDVEDGRVLALVDESTREPDLALADGGGAALRPLAKAASIFKIVTASALLRDGVSLQEQACGTGGKTRLKPKNLVDDGRGRCVRFEDALPLSQNVAMAKLASRHLVPGQLRLEAALFGFDMPLPFAYATAASPAPIDDEPFAFATTAAGFGDVRLSALHAAQLAATVGTGGLVLSPSIIATVQGEVPPPPPAAPRRVLDEQQAGVLQAMMAATVERGTAARAFSRSERGFRAFDAVPVAGKTGSLTDREVDLDYTWFVGTAPAHHPKVAIAVVIVNDEWLWHVRALDIAKLALRATFAAHPEWARADEPVARR
ncbi:MAG: penicillin-binding protein [Deltaproteobacteria bacterium]|nr:penicillin-binding protein [Deltaproteobacteria bacterium]